MIAKLITHGKDRAEALEMMRRALDQYVIHGVTHNIAFLREVMDNKRFIDGDISTKFIPNEYPQGFKGTVLTNFDKQVLINSAVHVYSQILHNRVNLTGQVPSFDREKYVQTKVQELFITTKVRGEEDNHLFNFKLAKITSKNGRHRVEGVITGSHLPSQLVKVESEYKRGDDFFTAHVESGGKDGNEKGDFVVQVAGASGDGKFSLQLRGTPIEVNVYTPREYELLLHMPVAQEIDFSKMVISPMPGAVVSVSVKVGDQVVPGQEVCVIEAMKMQNALYIQAAGKVKAVYAKPGATVSAGDPLVEIE
jgi:propionyl-CoA carboxylase alpha chain